MTTLQFITGLLDWLLADPSHIVTAAAALAAATPTPDPASVWGKLYRVLEIFALNVLHAKETGGADASPATVAANAPVFAAQPQPQAPLGGGTVRSLAVGLLALTALGMSACAGKPPATDVFEIRAGYDATVLAPISAYATLPACPATSAPAAAATGAPVCKDARVLAKLVQADSAAKAALDAAETTVRQHPEMDASTAVAAAQNAVTAAQTILATYHIK